MGITRRAATAALLSMVACGAFTSRSLAASSAEIDRKTAFRTTILSVANSLMYLLTILVFFLKTNMK